MVLWVLLRRHHQRIGVLWMWNMQMTLKCTVILKITIILLLTIWLYIVENTNIPFVRWVGMGWIGWVIHVSSDGEYILYCPRLGFAVHDFSDVLPMLFFWTRSENIPVAFTIVFAFNIITYSNVCYFNFRWQEMIATVTKESNVWLTSRLPLYLWFQVQNTKWFFGGRGKWPLGLFQPSSNPTFFLGRWQRFFYQLLCQSVEL